jgi:hypothetical protein
MAWPLSQDYNEAVQNPGSCFGDAELRAGQVTTNALGLPVPRSGNFADVYEFRCPATGGRWAVKCFTRAVPGLRDRYAEISRYLEQANLPFTVDFTFLEQGIRVRGEWYPILKMRWVEGLLLNEFVRDSLGKPALLESLGQIWLRMARRLREARVTHGDLQHGNVLLVPGSKTSSLAVKLVDYDGLCVPALVGRATGEVGHPAYQHCQRRCEDAGRPDLDRFPLLLVATALRCLTVGGRALWDRYDNGDNLLFREADLRAPAESALFKELWQLGDPVAHALVGFLAVASHATLEQVPIVDELLADGGIAILDPEREEQLTTLWGSGMAGRTAMVSTSTVATQDSGLDFGATAPLVSSPIRRRRRAGTLPAWVKAVGGVAGLAVAVGLAIWMAHQGSGARNEEAAAVLPPSRPSKPSAPRDHAGTVSNGNVKDRRPERGDEPTEPAARLPVLKETILVRVGGYGGSAFQDRPDELALLVGFNFTTVDFGGGTFIKSLQPIYLTSRGRVEGKVYGEPSTNRVRREAKPGFAVGGILARQDPDDLKIVFVRVKGTALDLHDVDESAWVCNRASEHTTLLAGDGTLVVGIYGRCGANADALGLLTLADDPANTELIRSLARETTTDTSPGERKPSADKVAAKAPVPAGDALATAENVVQDVHRADYAKRKPAQMRTLAARLFQEGLDTRDKDAVRFVLFREARDLAADAGDLGLALAAIRELARHYAVDALAIKAMTLERLERAATTSSGHRLVVETVLGAVEEALGADRYDDAGRLVKIAEATAPKAASLNLVSLVQARAKEVESWRGEYERVREAADQLTKDPKDSQANLTLGRYFGLVKGDWARGLPLMGQGSDARWKGIAAKDLAEPAGPDAQVEVGDGWWGLAEAETGLAKKRLRERAFYWYKRAEPRLTGLAKAKVEQRLALTVQEFPDLETVGPIWTMQGHTNNLHGVAISADGRRALSGSEDKTARLWNLETGKAVRVFPSSGALSHVTFASDVLAFSTRDAVLLLWDLRTGGLVRTFTGHTGGILSTSLSRDGRFILSASHDRTARLWDVATGRQIRQFTGHSHIVHAVAFSPDGGHVLTGSFDHTIRLWTTADAKEVRRFEGDPGQVLSVAFSPDGRRALSGADDKCVRLWDVDTGKEIQRFEGHGDVVRSVTFSPDGRRALSVSYDKTVRLWDVDTGKELCRLEGSVGGINDVVFTPDGRRALSGGMNAALNLWGLPRW